MKKLFSLCFGLLFAWTVQAQTKSQIINDTIVVYANCEHCVERIESVLKPMQGIVSARMDVSVGKLFVSYDASITNNDDIQILVAKIGHDTKMHRANDKTYQSLPACCKYERAPLNNQKSKYETVHLLIEGMTCAEGCAKGIELKLYQQKGVKFSEVNYDTKKAKVIFDPAKISLQKIIQLIETFKPENGENNKYSVKILP